MLGDAIDCTSFSEAAFGSDFPSLHQAVTGGKSGNEVDVLLNYQNGGIPFGMIAHENVSNPINREGLKPFRHLIQENKLGLG